MATDPEATVKGGDVEVPRFAGGARVAHVGGDRANRQCASTRIVHHDLQSLAHARIKPAHASVKGEVGRGSAVTVADRAGRDGHRERQGSRRQRGRE